MKSTTTIRLLAGLLCLYTNALFAQADDYTEVSRLIRNGQHSQALSKIDQSLSAKPRDPQMRFFKGVVQSESGRNNDAINTFTRLTEDYPELPEPYNNLAVLYAASNQLDKARAALEMAIRTNPSYSTAHENLGDIYAKLASQAYAKALQLEGSNAAVQPKLALIRDLFNPNAPSVKPKPSVTPTPAPATAPTAPSTPSAAPPQSNNGSQSPAPQPNPANAQEPQAAVQAWAKAWSDRNMGAYLAAYGKDFAPPNNQSRAAWEEERKLRIMGKAKINVKLSELTVQVSGNTAKAKFKQEYRADTLTANSRKTLDLVKAGNQWVIVRETSG